MTRVLDPVRDEQEIRARIRELRERVVTRFEHPWRQRTRMIGQMLVSGSELLGSRTMPYERQLEYLLLEKNALAKPGQTIAVRKFFEDNKAILGPLPEELEDVIGLVMPPIDGSAPGLYSRPQTDPEELWHQARILFSLCSRGPQPPHVICQLPQGSGRTSAAFVAALHALITQLSSVLFISPTARAARLMARRFDEFLSSSGWGQAVTAALFIDKSRHDPLATRLQSFTWNDIEEEIVSQREGGELLNVVVTTPEHLERLILRHHPRYREFLADLHLIIVDEADAYCGTYGSHVSLILRRLRRLLSRYGANYRTLTAVAPYDNAAQHVRRLLGFDDDRDDVFEDLVEVHAAEDHAPWPPRMVSTWTPAMRFAEIGGGAVDPEAHVDALVGVPLRLSNRDGLLALLSGLAHSLASEEDEVMNPAGSGEDRATRILVLAREDVLTEDDLKRWETRGYRPELIHSLNELDTDAVDTRAIVVFGYFGSWSSLFHQLAHFGRTGTWIVLAAGSDSLSRNLVHEAESFFGQRRAGLEAAISPLVFEDAGPLRVLEASTESLFIEPHNREILKLHLFLASSAEGGIDEPELRRFFGPTAADALKALRGEIDGYHQRHFGTSGEEVVRHLFDQDGEARWDPLCVAWDRPGRRRNLVPLVTSEGGATHTIGHVERHLAPLQVRPDTTDGSYSSVMLRRRRRLVTTAVDEQQISVRYGEGTAMEYRPRLSRLIVTSLDAVHEQQEHRIAAGEGLRDLVFRMALVKAELREEVVGQVQMDGYAPAETALVVNQKPGSSGAPFATHALLLQFDEITADRDFGVLHSLVHLLKATIPRFLRHDPEELEIRVFPQTAAADDEWHIIIYDNHPEGDCYARALFDLKTSWWKELLETGYRLLRNCPCHPTHKRDGCWQCLKVFECRELHPDSDEESASNTRLDKVGTFRYLGERFDPDWQLFWRLKCGDTEDGDTAWFEQRIRYLASRVVRVLRDKCGFEIPDKPATLQFTPHIPTPGRYLSGPDIVQAWPPPKGGLTEADYIYLLAHEYTHNWQFKSGQFNYPRLCHYNFENIRDENNVPFQGRLFLEGCARWAETQVCDYFGIDQHMVNIRRDSHFDEYQLGYKLFLFMEYHIDFARILDFLQTGDILYHLPDDSGWALVDDPPGYSKYILDDPRLGILTILVSHPLTEAKCSDPAYGAVMGSYLRGGRRAIADDTSSSSEPPVDLPENPAFDPLAPIGDVIDALGSEALEKLNLHCLGCPRSRAPVGDADSEARFCTSVDAAHLHSSEERSTSQIISAIQQLFETKDEEHEKRRRQREDRKKPAATTGSSKVQEHAIDLNSASVQELQGLPGVGKVLAQRIAAARPFSSLDDVRRVKGVSRSRIDTWAGQVVIGGHSPAS